MDVFDLTATIKLEVDGYLSSLDTAEKKTAGFSKSSGNLLSSLARIGTAAFGAAEAAIGFFAKSAVSAGMTFDKSMGQVQATMGATAEEIEASVGSVDTSFGHFEGNLREFAQFMGQNTAFSATQAAQALNYMALAGYNTQQSMEMLPNVLNMAAAGGMELARASDMVTDTQSALGLSAERTSQMVDEFAKAASTGNTNVEQLGEAFLRVGGLARELNGGMVLLADGTMEEVDNVQELEIAFTAMANAGVKGAEAGTHMRNMIMKLSSPTDKGAEAMEALGVSVFDAEGKMRSLVDIFTDLRVGLESVSQQEKLEAISEIFNARDLASAEALLSAVDQDWDRIGESILDAQGAAAQMAATQLDNLTGDMTLFRSALESAQITISDNLTPALREFVQFGTRGVSELTSAFQEGGLDAAMSKFGDLLSEGLSMLVEGLPDAVKAATSLLGALGTGILENVPQIAEAGARMAVILGDAILDGFPKVLSRMAEMLPMAFDGIAQFISQALGSVINAMPNIIAAISKMLQNFIRSIPTIMRGIKKILPQIIDLLASFIQNVVEQLPEIMDAFFEALPDIIQTVADILVDNIPIFITAFTRMLNALVQTLPKLISAISRVLPQIITSIVRILPRIITAVSKALVENMPIIIEGIVILVTEIVKQLPTILMAIVDALIKFGPKIFEGFMTALGSIFTGIGELGAKLWEAAKGLGASIIGGIVEFFEDPAAAVTVGAEWLLSMIFGEKVTIDEVKNAFIDWWNNDGPGQLSSESWEDILAGCKLMLEDAGSFLLSKIFGQKVTTEEVKNAFTDWWNTDGLGAITSEDWDTILKGLGSVLFEDSSWFVDALFGSMGGATPAEKVADTVIGVMEPLNGLMGKLDEMGIGWNNFWSGVAGTWDVGNAITALGGGTLQFNVGNWLDGSVFQPFRDAWDSFRGWWDEGWGSAFSVIITTFDEYKNPIAAIWEMIKQSFPVNEAYDWGVELVESFFNGIMATLSSFTMGGGIVEAAKAKGADAGNRIAGPNYSNPNSVVSPAFGGGSDAGSYGNSGGTGGSVRLDSYDVSRFATPQAATSARRSSFGDDATSDRVVELLEDIANKDTRISLEGDAAGVFRMVERENKRKTRATRYNSLSMVRS